MCVCTGIVVNEKKEKSGTEEDHENKVCTKEGYKRGVRIN